LSITDLASCVYRPDRCIALRGKLQNGQFTRSIYPAAASTETILTVTSFLGLLGMNAQPEADPDLPALVKNSVSIP
jgi:3-hydroxybutyryl-CoA dehydrogenase